MSHLPCFSQNSSGVLFLLISPSPSANGMGNTYSALGSDDPMAMFFNPAFAGLLAKDHYFGGGFYPQRTAWLSSLADGMTYSHQSYHAGWNFNHLKVKIPVSVGISYSRTFFDAGEMVITGESDPEPLGFYMSWDRAHTFSVGFCIDYYIRLSAGMSLKYIESNLFATMVGGNVVESPGKGDATDYGFIVQLPVVEALQKIWNVPIYIIPQIQPYMIPGFTYSEANIGDGISYTQPVLKDPLPRVARAGVGLEGGFIWMKENVPWRLAGFKWASEAEDDLVQREGANVTYQKGLGDIDFFHDVLGGKANHNIIKHEGVELHLLDLLHFRSGRYEDRTGSVCYKTGGFGLQLSGLFKTFRFFFPRLNQNRFLRFITERLDIRYHESEYRFSPSDHPLAGTRYRGFSIMI